MKKILALLCAFVVLISITVPAFATNVPNFDTLAKYEELIKGNWRVKSPRNSMMDKYAKGLPLRFGNGDYILTVGGDGTVYITFPDDSVYNAEQTAIVSFSLDGQYLVIYIGNLIANIYEKY